MRILVECESLRSVGDGLCSTVSSSLTSNFLRIFICILCYHSNVSFDIFIRFTPHSSLPMLSHLFQTFLLMSLWGESIAGIALRFGPKKSLLKMKLTLFFCSLEFAIFWGCDD